MQLKPGSFKSIKIIMDNIQIIKEEQNPLFERKEVLVSLISETTPKREEALKLLSDKFNSSSENIKVLGINRKYGSKEIEINANIYRSKDSKNSLEIKKKKDTELEKKQAATAEEKPAEELKGEAQPETKSEEEVKEEKTEEKIEEEKKDEQ